MFVYSWVGILKVYELVVHKCKNVLLKMAKIKQENYLIKNKIGKLVQSIKIEMFLEDKLNRITPYFPDITKKNYSDEQLMFAIRKNNEVFFFYLKKLLPIRFSNFLFILILVHYYLSINIFVYYTFLTWDNIKKIASHLPFIPYMITFLILIASFYFTSKSGLFRKAKNKVKIEELEHKIKFHKNNRIILSSLLFEGYINIERCIFKRNNLISELEKNRDNTIIAISFNWLVDLEGINEIDKFMRYTEEKNRDLFPFILGINHISFWKLEQIYSDIFSQKGNRINKLNEIFMTKKYMEELINHRYFMSNVEKNLNESILKSVKTIIHIEKYLQIINNQINKPNSIFTFFAFITNKDK